MPHRLTESWTIFYVSCNCLLLAVSPEMGPGSVFLCSFLLGAAAGFTAHIYRAVPVPPRQLLGGTLYGGLLGLIAALLWYQYYEGKNLYALIGLSGAFGFGGVSTVDLCLRYLSGGGVSITIQPKDPEHDVQPLEKSDQETK